MRRRIFGGFQQVPDGSLAVFGRGAGSLANLAARLASEPTAAAEEFLQQVRLRVAVVLAPPVLRRPSSSLDVSVLSGIVIVLACWWTMRWWRRGDLLPIEA
ncbi:MAG TPA: hypothetical protein VEY92_12500 [Pseudoxanthomonas sp.]|nr:hypothetical protein [Pseudoxanthomonas sp.]